jgi:hypothetical protein
LASPTYRGGINLFSYALRAPQNKLIPTTQLTIQSKVKEEKTMTNLKKIVVAL